jgi:cytochrome c oxidase subunit 2
VGRGLIGVRAAAVALGLVGCGLASPQTTLEPRSDFAVQSHDIFLQILWWDLLIFAVVAVVLAVAVVRFRERAPGAVPRQVRGHPRLELAWTIAPALVLVFIAFPTVRTVFRTQAAPAPDALRVRVVGHQWWWEFQYPDLGITTATELHLPAGRAVVLELTSPDVVHSFWAPPLGGKRDANPGQVNRMAFTPLEPGVYPGQCGEFCGVSHANMRLLVQVHPVEAFRAWVAREQAAPPDPAEGSAAARGRQVFTATACVGCHAVRGISSGQVGPDLTHVGARRTLAGGVLKNTPEELARWLRDPPALKPGSLMPALGLTDGQVQDLVAWLSSLR